jgi:hypothetical protein
MDKGRTNQKRETQGTSRTGKTNQYRARGTKSVGSSKPGGDGPGTTKVKRNHDDKETRKQAPNRFRS